MSRYAVVDGAARKVTKRYTVVDGVTRKVNKRYVVEDGVTRLVFSGAAEVAYTGNFTVTDVEVSGVPYLLYTLTSSGTLTLGGEAEYWMCAAGNSGAKGAITNYTTYEYTSGPGGGGGKVASGALSSGEYVVTIGAAASSTKGIGGATKIGSITAENDATAEHYYGASGGGSALIGKNEDNVIPSSANTGSGESTIPFEGRITSGFANQKHSPGGGGGTYSYYSNSCAHYRLCGAGGSNGSNGLQVYKNDIYYSPTTAPGGDYGGGNGASSGDGGNGSFYGAGGGGGRAVRTTNKYKEVEVSNQGTGYQGVVYLLVPA